MEQFKVIGYYICETKKTPEGFYGIGQQVLSVSRWWEFMSEKDFKICDEGKRSLWSIWRFY